MRSSNAPRPSVLLAELFPSLAVAAYELRGAADPALLLPEEAAACTMFRANRLEEFAAGRLCARGALGEFGLGKFAVRRNADRTPQWPPGFVGSITHTIGFCGAIAASCEQLAGVGIDVEIVARVTPDVWSRALTQDDIARISAQTPPEPERAAAIIFSAKEAFYKCQSRITGIWLDYTDVNVELLSEGADRGAFIVRPATTAVRRVLNGFAVRGRYLIADALVFTGVALSPEDAKTLVPTGLRIAS